MVILAVLHGNFLSGYTIFFYGMSIVFFFFFGGGGDDVVCSHLILC